MVNQIHHIGIAVKNLDDAIHFWTEVFGLRLIDRVNWPGLDGAILNIGGNIIELIEPHEAIIPVGKSLVQMVKEHGGGVHHICFEVDDIDQELKTLREAGIKLLDEVPQITKGGRIAWLDEQTVDGLMLELCEKGYQIG
jgi:methylmalonyl-CoA epimerase